MTWRDGIQGREVKEGGDVCIIMADLHCFRAETQHGKDFLKYLNKKWKKEMNSMQV